MESVKNIFCEKLRQIRKGLRMSQQEFADSLGIKRPTMGNYETGVSEPTLSFFRSMREKYHIDLNWLIMDEDSMEMTAGQEAAEPMPEYAVKLNSVLLEKLLIHIEITAQERGMFLTAKQKARILALTYEAQARNPAAEVKGFLTRTMELTEKL